MDKENGLFETMYNLRSIRRFKPDPVPEELILKLVEAATKAPSGGNSQPWRFIIVRDQTLKNKIGEFYRMSWEASYGKKTGQRPLQPRVRASSAYLAEHMHEAPVLILVCIQHGGMPSSMSRGASIYPAVQNLLLAASGYGLGGVLTTLHKKYESEIKQLLAIPDNVETAALLPIGYPAEGERYGPTRRLPPEDITHWDRWESRV